MFSPLRSVKRGHHSIRIAVCVLLLGQPTFAEIDFDRDVRPLLSNNCFECHGPDANTREADLRLDERESLFGTRESPLIVPHKPESSELVRRIVSDDEDTKMPPRDSGKSLSDVERATIRQWISEGAKWQTHWSFVKPSRPNVPSVEGGTILNEVDAFIQRRLSETELTASGTADRVTLIRRLYFDLLGLPPTYEEVSAFVDNRSPDAYEKLVDQLLASPHFGERMAVYWLDVVRYADSNGYHSDEPRSIAPYRDYVIDSFNKNKPYDQFTIEQLAGDLLPNPTLEQNVASGFNMLLQTTREGGAQAKEYLAKYSADRVRNTASIFLGVTLGCAECHDHKFDPFTTRDFYSFAAFFADVTEEGVGNPIEYPLIDSSADSTLAEFDAKIAPLRSELAKKTELANDRQVIWESQLSAPSPDAEVPKELVEAVAVNASERTDKQTALIVSHFQTHDPDLKPLRDQLDKAIAARKQFHDSLSKTLMTVSTQPRTIRVLARGNWQDDSGEEVSPAVPRFLNRIGSAQLTNRSDRLSRLDLANWILDAENPLTSRTFVNRLWKLFFGQGLATPLDDLGAQGVRPTHPELLDFLAVEFVESKWNVKQMVKLLVMSNTYRQSSITTHDQRAADPNNQWYARQSRFRLDAEMVRDNALSISGLLVRKIGGESVKPYQPAGYWQHMNFPVRQWTHDRNDDLYRRGLYTWWQRMFLHPGMMAFDAPSREECTVERARSNTPQQALVLLNDPTYVEAARTFAEAAILTTADGSPDAQIQWMFQQGVSRSPQPAEAELVRDIYNKHLSQYRSDPKAADQLLGVGERPVSETMDAAELAATTSVARVILNLHETITRP